MEAVNVPVIDLTGESYASYRISGETGKDLLVPKARRSKRKHIPHSQRPYQFVERRNLREKKRVHEMNRALEILSTHLPLHGTGISVSRINILRYAITYIRELQNMIIQHDSCMGLVGAMEDSLGESMGVTSPGTANNSMDSDSSTGSNLTMFNFENRLYAGMQKHAANSVSTPRIPVDPTHCSADDNKLYQCGGSTPQAATTFHDSIHPYRMDFQRFPMGTPLGPDATTALFSDIADAIPEIVLPETSTCSLPFHLDREVPCTTFYEGAGYGQHDLSLHAVSSFSSCRYSETS